MFTFTVYDSLKVKKVKSVMSWKFLMKKKPAIIRYIETRRGISNIETRRTFFSLRGCFLLYGSSNLNLMTWP